MRITFQTGTRYGLSASALTFVIALAGCSSQSMSTSDTVRGARADVISALEENGNTHVTLQVKNLVKPAAVEPTATTYVVWAQELDEGQVMRSPRNLGALRVDENREGRLSAVTPLRKFDIFITPEPVAAAEEPSGPRTLWTSVVE